MTQHSMRQLVDAYYKYRTCNTANPDIVLRRTGTGQIRAGRYMTSDPEIQRLLVTNYSLVVHIPCRGRCSDMRRDHDEMTH